MELNPFTRTQDPITIADIQAIEEKYGFTLPEDYKEHLLQNNGGRPKRRVFPQATDEGRIVERKIRSFYPVKNGMITLESALKDLRDQLHDDLVPFGEESGGDQFVLSVGPEDYGSIYYVAHEFYQPPFSDDDYNEETDTSTPPPPRQYGEGVHFLAPSFTAFLDGLVEGSPVA